MARYSRKDSPKVDALQFDGTEESALSIRLAFGNKVWPNYGVDGTFTKNVFILTNNGISTIVTGDWILKDDAGELQTLAPDVFSVGFSPAQADPK